jgi:hypothetical protein
MDQCIGHTGICLLYVLASCLNDVKLTASVYSQALHMDLSEASGV